LYTVDVEVPGQPIGGGMLRVRQLSRLLGELGHEVTVSMPLESVLAFGGAGEVVDTAHDAHDPQRVALDLKPDVVLCAQWHLVPALGALDVPLWLDLHGSLLAENAFRHEGGSESAARYGQEVLAKLAAFGRADVVTCTGARQRLYFRGWRAISGGTYNDWEVVHLPLSLRPEPELPAASSRPGLHYLFAGNLWPWIDLASWLPGFFNVLAERPQDEVHFFVDDPVDRKDGREVIAAAGAGPGLERLFAEGRCTVERRLGHDAYRTVAREHDLALDLFGPNLERELAVTTRTLEYLSFGIPVIYPHHAELSAMIGETGCGWVLDPLEPAAISSTLTGIDEDAVRARTVAARTTAALEALEDQASSRCRDVVERALLTVVGARSLGGERRFEARLGASAIEGLREVRRELAHERDIVAGLEREMEERRREADGRRSELERRVGERDDTIRHLERAAAAEIARREELERAAAANEQRLRELGREIESGARRFAEVQQVASERQQRIQVLEKKVAEEGRRNDLNALAGARQTGLALRSLMPGRGRRGFGRRLHLLVLYLDHIATRAYLALWQRARRQRIFPGM